MTSAWFYDAEGHDEQIELKTARVETLAEHQLLWLDIERNDKKALGEAAEILGLLPTATRLIETPPNPPRIDNYEHFFQLSVPLPPRSAIKGARLDFIVGEKWLMTVRDGDVPFLAEFRKQDRGESFRGKLTPGALAASLLDWHLEEYQFELNDIQQQVDTIDANILSEADTRTPLATLAKMRSRVAQLRDTLGAHRPIIHGLLRPDFNPLAEKPEVPYFQALERHFERTEDAIDRARETVVGSFELYAARTAQQTNELVKVLTLVTVIIGLVGAVAGVFGMNFDTPIPHSGIVGFMSVVVGMFVLGTMVVVVARWRRWL